MGGISVIVSLFKGAVTMAARAAVADIRRFEEFRTDHLNEILTVRIACRTVGAFFVVAVRFAGRTDMKLITS
jgi:hypothetical protein